MARTEIDVPHLGGIVTFATPLHGPGYYRKVMGKISSDSLLRPTTAQIFSLVNLAMQNEDEYHCAELLKRFKEDYLWTATEGLFFREGVIVYDNIRGDMPTNSKRLMEILESGDERLRFVENGFETGIMSISNFLKNPYLIAQVGGENMLPTVEKVAEKISEEGAYVYVYGLNCADKAPKGIKVCFALDRYVGRLRVGGGYGGYLAGSRPGCAFGIVDTGEGSHAKKCDVLHSPKGLGVL